MEYNIGNMSTIATTLWVSIIAPILLYFGITIDQTLGIGIVTGIITVAFMIWNAKNPNQFAALGNAPEKDEITGVEDDVC